MTTVADKIKSLATLENAREYQKQNDKYIFAEGLIESELNIVARLQSVCYLETCFDNILKQEKEKDMQKLDQHKAYSYVFSPLTGERLTLGYCLKLMEKHRDGTITSAETLDMKLAVAWHDALNESMKNE